MLKPLDISQNPYMGVLSLTSDEVTLVPEQTDEEDLEVFREALATEVYPCLFGGLSLLGSLAVMNSGALILPDYVDLSELDIRNDLEISQHLRTKLNAFGNNILANDRFALIHPDYSFRQAKEIGDILHVEVERGTIAGFKTVGSVAVVTNKGLLAHPMTAKDDLDHLAEVFRVPCAIGTANYGVGQVGACVVANTRGAVVGNLSTGIELGRVEDALSLY